MKHAHQLLPKLLELRRLLLVEFPFPLKRRCGGIVFLIFLCRLTLIVPGGFFRGLLAFG
jgi:hypothetical protein